MQIQKIEIKNKILDVSSKLFMSGGYKQTSLNDIAKECGISKSNIYNYFKSKNCIFDALTVEAKEKLTFISKLLASNPFVGSENLQEGLLFILFNHILPVKEGVILIFDREMEENDKHYISDLLDIINNMVVPDLTIDENTDVLKIIAENLVNGYLNILKAEGQEKNMKYQIAALTEYHVGGLAFLKQSVMEKKNE
ncbi:TetR/AcrR family transcriptional regulator [uncultured Vagococcus sp.]|uniref:TetR/AcrR family transcriptional regulator n=1 Tax=uncultured Vagococcus sp. TaxID=189676 RepID=UPI0028D8F05B|nr:TetR/AcrR family transcriptional regulator [uncultured Vagococcus sp.]